MGVMSILDRTGDTRLMWDSDNDEEVANAQRTFDDLTKKGHLAYRAEGKAGEKGEQMKKFDKHAERIIFVPRLVGG